MSLKRNMKFELPIFGRRPPRGLKDAPAAPRPRPKKTSFIAAARGILDAANNSTSSLASRWQLVLQQAHAGKQ
jgi:hypothetical protein